MNALAFSPDGKLLANSVTDVAFSPDEQRIISAGADRRVLIWPVREES